MPSTCKGFLIFFLSLITAVFPLRVKFFLKLLYNFSFIEKSPIDSKYMRIYINLSETGLWGQENGYFCLLRSSGFLRVTRWQMLMSLSWMSISVIWYMTFCFEPLVWDIEIECYCIYVIEILLNFILHPPYSQSNNRGNIKSVVIDYFIMFHWWISDKHIILILITIKSR